MRGLKPAHTPPADDPVVVCYSVVVAEARLHGSHPVLPLQRPRIRQQFLQLLEDLAHDLHGVPVNEAGILAVGSGVENSHTLAPLQEEVFLDVELCGEDAVFAVEGADALDCFEEVDAGGVEA